MQGSNASWPVGGATRQSGGNWVGRFEKPEDWSIWASMYSSNLELGQLITVGDAILKWTASGVKFVDAVFATQADFDSFCSKIGTPIATGSTAMVNGVQYTYGAAGWEGAGTALPTYPTYEALNAAMPAGVQGRCASVKQISGPGDYKCYDTGTRWAVCPGEAPVCDTVETTINADAGMLGVYQTLGSYAIPAGLIGDREVWEWCDTAMQSAGTAAATVGVVIGANTFLSAVAFSTPSSAMMRGWRRLRRRGSGLLRMYSTSAAESNAAGTLANFTVAADFSQAQTLAYRVAPSSATDIITAYNFAIRRAA